MRTPRDRLRDIERIDDACPIARGGIEDEEVVVICRTFAATKNKDAPVDLGGRVGTAGRGNVAHCLGVRPLHGFYGRVGVGVGRRRVTVDLPVSKVRISREHT